MKGIHKNYHISLTHTKIKKSDNTNKIIVSQDFGGI